MKEKAIDLFKLEGLSQNQALRILDFNKSTLYYHSKKDDSELITEIRRIAFLRKKDGYRRIHQKLKRSGIRVNHKRVYRLYTLEGLKIRTRPKRRRKDIPSVPLPVPNEPNTVWALDFVHERSMDGRKQRIVTGIDLCSRINTLLEVSYSISSTTLIRFLERLPILPKFFVLDNGTEFTSKLFIDWAIHRGIQIHFIDKGKPTQNAFIESFNGKLRNECLDMNRFRNQNEIAEELRQFQIYYNNERQHSSLNYLTPNEYKMRFV